MKLILAQHMVCALFYLLQQYSQTSPYPGSVNSDSAHN